MGSVLDFQTFDDQLNSLITLYHFYGMSYDDIANKLSKKSVLVKCFDKCEKEGLIDKLREVVKSSMEVD